MKCRQCLLRLMMGIRLDRREEFLSYSIDLQSVCKMMDFSRSNLVRIKMDLFQCLWTETIETQRFIREKSSLLTWLFFNASPRGLGKLRHQSTSNQDRVLWVSVEREEQWDHECEQLYSNLIDFQRFSKRLNSYIANLISHKIQRCEWLSMMKIVANNENETRDSRTWLIFNASAGYWRPSLPISLNCRRSVSSP